MAAQRAPGSLVASRMHQPVSVGMRQHAALAHPRIAVRAPDSGFVAAVDHRASRRAKPRSHARRPSTDGRCGRRRARIGIASSATTGSFDTTQPEGKG
jgi:hypothetical protein